MYWAGDIAWNLDVASWRQLSAELPASHAAQIDDYLVTRGWCQSSDTFLERLRVSAMTIGGPNTLGQEVLQEWFDRLKLYEPPSAWAEPDGVFRPVAEALSATSRKLRCRMVYRAGSLGLETEQGAQKGASSPVTPWDTHDGVALLHASSERFLLQLDSPDICPDMSKWRRAPQPPFAPWANREGRDGFGRWAEVDIKGVSVRFRYIEPGTFMMGSPESDEESDGDERPRHEVMLSEGYWLSETPCTQALWQAVTGDNPSELKGAEHPVEQVSWDDVQGLLAVCFG